MIPLRPLDMLVALLGLTRARAAWRRWRAALAYWPEVVARERQRAREEVPPARDPVELDAEERAMVEPVERDTLPPSGAPREAE